MDSTRILLTLTSQNHDAPAQSQELRQKALSIVKTIEDNVSSSQLSESLLQLLIEVIKPLFLKTQHPQLTSTGRKNLVPSNIPAAARFSTSSIFDEDATPWKNGWCVPLLEYILSRYGNIDEALRKKTIEAQFHLLVPPVLHQIDDIDIKHKAMGCRCLRVLADILISAQSTILKRTGLTDVFIDALKTNFLLLPSLTPEDDSLGLLQELYPAYRALVKARFVQSHDNDTKEASSRKVTNVTERTSSLNLNGAALTKDSNAAERKLRQSYLTVLLRHQLLHSLSHLSTGTSAGGTMSLPLSTFLVSQVTWIVQDMRIAATCHLQELIPLLRNILADPFGSASPDLLLNATTALEMIIQVCWPRIADRWFAECLRGIVGCWANINDDEPEIKEESRKEKVGQVKSQLKILVMLLEDVSQQNLAQARRKLLDEDEELKPLFST